MASVTERLALIVQASTGGAVKGLREVAGAAKEMAAAEGLAEKEMAALQARAAAAQATLAGGLGITALQAKLSTLGPAGVAVAGGLNKVVTAASAVGPAGLVAGATAALGIGLLVKATGEGVENLERIAGEVRAYRAASGASAEESSRFAGAMRLLNVDIDAGVRAFGLLATTIKQHPEKLERYGVAIAKNERGYADLSGTLLNVGDRYKELSAAGDKAAALDLAKSTLGRGFSQLTPLLARSRGEIQALFDSVDEHHEVLSDEDLANTRELAIAGRELTAAFEGFGIQLAKGVVPALVDITNAATSAVEWLDRLANAKGPDWLGLDVQQIASDLFGPLDPKNIGLGLSFVGEKLHLVARGSTDAQRSAIRHAEAESRRSAEARLAAAEADKEAKALAALANVVEGALRADRALAAAQHGVVEAERGVAVAARGVVNARRGVRDATERLNDVLARGEEVTHRIELAQRGLADADLAVADATERLAAARKKVNDLLAGPSTRDRSRAELAVKQATLGVAEANERVADAQRRVADAQDPRRGGDRFATQADQAAAVATAELDLASAGLGAEQAQLSLADAQDALNELLNRGKEGSDELAEAQRDLRDAERQVGQAVFQHGEAQRQLNAANAGVAEHEREIRDAREGLASATQSVADATHAVASANDAASRARDTLTDAILNAARAHEAEDRMIDNSIKGLLLYRAELEALALRSPQFMAALRPLLDRVNADIAANYERNGGGDTRVRVTDAGFARGAIFAPGGIPRNAYGDVYNKPTLGVFGEAGPEMILPLSKAKRSYALSLLARSGLARDMFPQFASGAIVGAPRIPRAALSGGWGGSGQSVVMHVGPVYANDHAGGEAALAVIVDGLKKLSKRGPLPIRVTGSVESSRFPTPTG